MQTFHSIDLTKQSGVVNKVFKVTLVLVAVIVLMLFLPWQQTVKGEGKLIAYYPSERFYSIKAPIDGFVKHIHVRENDTVAHDDVLLEMVDLDSEFLARNTFIDKSIKKQLEATRTMNETLKNNKANLIAQLNVGTKLFDKRIRQQSDTIKSITYELQAAHKRLEIEQAHSLRIKNLFDESIESKRSLDLAQFAYKEANATHEALKLKLQMSTRNLEILKDEQKQFDLSMTHKIQALDNQIQTNTISLNSLKQQEMRQDTNIARFKQGSIKAKQAGKVVQVHINDTHRYVSKGETLISFAPKVSKRTIRMKISDFNMPLLKERLHARIMFYGWPALNIPGWPSINAGTFEGIVERVDPIAHEKGFYYVYIVQNPNNPWPNVEVLRLGTRATVYVRLTTVPIWQQIWRKINAFPPNMPTPEATK